MEKPLLIICLGLQIFFWSFAQDEKPNLGVMPIMPSEAEIEALSFGDKQLYFRSMAMNLQMAGDTFGRTTPLKDYNYPELLEWFRMMDTLDQRSNFIPSIAAYYFSRSQNTPDVKYMVEYLLEHGMVDMVVERSNLNKEIGNLLDLLMQPSKPYTADEDDSTGAVKSTKAKGKKGTKKGKKIGPVSLKSARSVKKQAANSSTASSNKKSQVK